MLQLNQQQSSSSAPQELNGIIDNSPIYVTSLTSSEAFNNNAPGAATTVVTSSASDPSRKPATDIILTQKIAPHDSESAGASVSPASVEYSAIRASSVDAGLKPVETRALGDRRASSPFQNGRTEVLIGAEENKFKTIAVVENNNNNNNKLPLGLDAEK